jgi:LDH2 family malate/lactate/ureidoglycolate dehydrogenase
VLCSSFYFAAKPHPNSIPQQGEPIMSKVIVPWDLITNFVTDAFIGYGIPAEDAKICTDVLLESDRRGIESHGCNRSVLSRESIGSSHVTST